MRNGFVRTFCAFLVLAFLTVQRADAAVGTVVLTSVDVGASVTKYTFTWTSDAAGVVSANAKSIQRGRILQAQFIANAAGTQPTDLYDATLVESASVDLLIASGANLSNTTSKVVLFYPPYFHDGSSTLDLVIANAGNAKGGQLILWVGP